MKRIKWLLPLLVAVFLLGGVLMSGGTSAHAAAQTAPETWRSVSSPNPSMTENTLLGVVAVAPNDVWAVGYYRADDTGAIKELIEHWNGTQWKYERCSCHDHTLGGRLFL